jgi:C4-dicarboxylate transporter DctM subunit
MFILVAVTALDYGFTTSGLQEHVSSILSVAGHNPLVFLLIVNLIFLLVHEFIETAPSILVLVPLIIPAALTAGVNPYQLGAVIAVNSTIGLVLPPVGVSLYVASQIAEVDPIRALRHLWKYVGGSLAVLAIVTVVPGVSTWLPSHW